MYLSMYKMKRKYIMTCLIFLAFYNMYLAFYNMYFFHVASLKMEKILCFLTRKERNATNGNTDRTQNKQAHSTINKNRHL